MVADVQSIRNRAIVKFIGKTVGKHGFAARFANLPVTKLVLIGLPLPALMRAAPVNMLPEAIFDWLSDMVIVNVIGGLAFDNAVFCPGVSRHGSWGAAAAFAKFW